MKISKKALEAMRKKYNSEIRSGRTSANQSGIVTDQTKWIFFDRKTIEKLLDEADPTTGGIRFYFGEYTTELAKEYFPENPEAYDGLLTLIMAAANLKDGKVQDLEFTEASGAAGGEIMRTTDNNALQIVIRPNSSLKVDPRFIQAFLNWYAVTIDFLLIVGIIYFFKLPKEKRANSYYWLPFLILSFTVLYENMGGFTKYNPEFNKWVNALFGNTENPKYNLWFFNIANKQISTILYLFLIKSWLEPSKKNYINWMIISFFIVIQVLQFSGIEPIYLDQPIIFTIGANMILIGSGLYFIGLMTNEKYLTTNPLRLLSFWQMTFVLFTYSLTYFFSVSLIYLYTNYPGSATSLLQINKVMGVLNLTILVLTLASPKFPNLFEREPAFKPEKERKFQNSTSM